LAPTFIREWKLSVLSFNGIKKPNRSKSLTVCLVVCCLAVMLLFRSTARAGQDDDVQKDPFFSAMEMDWGGYLRAIGTVSRVDDQPLYPHADSDPLLDGQLEWRLKNRLSMGPRWTVQTHYELVAFGGDTFEYAADLDRMVPVSLAPFLSFSDAVNDDRRLFDLTHVLTETDRYLAYHRLDRLNLTYARDGGTVRLGRQALTWGDGLVFNPMDLFNPFSPTAVQRDYKVGDDMAHVQLPIGPSETQLLYLPRRDPATGNLEEEDASYAVKYHAPAGPIEMDVMAARHYGDGIVGWGGSGYLGETAWRINTVYTLLDGESRQDNFFQIVANMDYAWMWGGKNVYGLVEFFYNGLGLAGNYENIVTDTDLLERLSRGELFTIGRYYLAGQVQVEVHPLVHLHTTAIVNLSDPSGILQPQVLWDVLNDWQIIAGLQWHWGGQGSEYGGYDLTVDGTTVNVSPADRAYLWLTCYF
jgi:hypothetical protein